MANSARETRRYLGKREIEKRFVAIAGRCPVADRKTGTV